MAGEAGTYRGRIGKPLVRGALPAGRVMDQHHPEQPLLAEFVELAAEPFELRMADPAGRHEGLGGNGSGDADQRHVAAPAHEGEGMGGGDVATRPIAAHIIAPVQERVMGGGTHIGVVIAGHDGNVGAGAQNLEEAQRGVVLVRQADIHQIAGHRDMIGRLLLDVGEQQVDRIGGESVPAAPAPVQHAEDPLACQFVEPGAGQRPEMGIGEMGEHKHEGFHSSPNPPVEGTAPAFQPRTLLPRRLIPRLIHALRRLRRSMTLGVRALVIDGKGDVLLVRHSYVPGWHLPGGGVERGEAAQEALARELAEEAAVEILAPPRLHGLLLNLNLGRRDHVAVYVIEHFRAGKPEVPNREILEIGFFPPAALPDDTTPATRRRIAEVVTGRPAALYW